ncbi:1-aminocyclopropane-1-carboxylate oxidase homolog 12-like [Vicia villosa]|uniref:1-aminocyclopropane-1-carboxylate oxidase homolog 12-like n=1 Tax=Vicia villosa TaxID=3911 RepID=UPI00273BF26E|nr:1-aminocyclopropane-1-carboxylate oxidase homolog 12-like [Vicia villosa]
MFHHQIEKDSASSSSSTTKLVVPFVDLADIHLDPTRRKTVVEKIREASETWSFFQVVNHGIDITVLDEMKNGVINFFDFITVLLQYHIGGLQILHENNWVDKHGHF